MVFCIFDDKDNIHIKKLKKNNSNYKGFFFNFFDCGGFIDIISYVLHIFY